MSESEIIEQFFEIGSIKFGKFVMKSGVTSPIYIDLRSIVSFPNLLRLISEKIWKLKSTSNIDLDVICGVPYTALPIATALSIIENVPMVMKRKEPKLYGTKKILEGTYSKGTKCLVIEDIVTSGSSVLETAEELRNEGIIVTDCIVIVDRQQGGAENLAKAGIKLHSLFYIKDMLNLLLSNSKIGPRTDIENALEYLNQNDQINIKSKSESQKNKSLSDPQSVINPILSKLRKIIEEKKSNLCVAADVKTVKELLNLGDILGPYICIFKTHIDILDNFNEKVPEALRQLAQKHNFLIMEDRKFADIGNTVIHQYRSGVYKIQDWADIVTVHSVPGEGIIEALKTSAVGEKACVLVAQMSTSGALTSNDYVKKAVEMAEKHKDFVIGFISQAKIASSDFVYMTPGINISSTGDGLGQKYRSPMDAIVKDGIDVVIVGRGIICAKNIEETAKLYKESSFKAYSTLKKA